jgi:hypothetical protein
MIKEALFDRGQSKLVKKNNEQKRKDLYRLTKAQTMTNLQIGGLANQLKKDESKSIKK